MNPHALHVFTDGASNYDSVQTGGIGFSIVFPDHLELEPIEGSINVNGQGIHKLELQGIIYAMDMVLDWSKQNPEPCRKITGGVIFHTDRHSIIDTELTGAYRIDGWRKNGWKTNDGTPIKHVDLLDQIDKKRRKISNTFSGKVEIVYTREKHNKKADHLSKAGKTSLVRVGRFTDKSKVKIAKRKYSGPEIDYVNLNVGDVIYLHCYRKVKVQDEYEICFDICQGDYEGCMVRTYVNYSVESRIHRFHVYSMVIVEVRTHSILISAEFTDVTEFFTKPDDETFQKQSLK